MGLAIVLRKGATPNRFRDLMLAAIAARKGSDVLICSGFFQELFRNSPYRASQEGNLAALLARQNARVTTLGIHNSYWLPSYRNFHLSLVKAKVQVNARYRLGLRWHAKVFILSHNGAGAFGIIGSSNLTRNAFGITMPMNNEADVVMWNTRDSAISHAVDTLLRDVPNFHEVIRAKYQPPFNGGLTVRKRLDLLRDEILSLSVQSL